jgi:CSLREA domain-containing protein
MYRLTRFGGTRQRTPLRRGPGPLHVEHLEDRTVPPTYVVNTTADTVDSDPNVTSLRETVLAANATPGIADVI